MGWRREAEPPLPPTPGSLDYVRTHPDLGEFLQPNASGSNTPATA